MARLFILIFAFNAFFTPVSAMGACEMMDEPNPEVMMSSMSDAMAGMDCEMEADTTVCASIECASNCSATNAPQLISEKLNFIIVAGNFQPSVGFAYFYKIILPVNTPPPLV